MEIHKTLDEAIEAGYVIRDRNHYDVSNKYWHWCTKNTKPFVAITKRTKYAQVEIDLLNTSLHGFSREVADEIIEGVKSIRCRKLHHVRLQVGGIYTYMPSVLIEDAEKVAKYFYEVALEKGNLATQKEMIEQSKREDAGRR